MWEKMKKGIIIIFTVLSLFVICKEKLSENTEKIKKVPEKAKMSEAAKKGKMVFTAKTCTVCHTKFGQGDLGLGTDLKDVMKK